MQQQEKNNNKGFNILELLVVLAIVGVISAVAYPNFSTWNKERGVRQSVVKIESLVKNILIQTERGTFAYVQVLFDNSNGSSLVVTSKGLTMQSLATKINDGSNIWNTDSTSRCNIADADYWDTDLDAAVISDEIKNAAYSLTFENVTTNFPGGAIPEDIGAVCFARNGKFFEGAGTLAESSSIPYEFIYICRRTTALQFCEVPYGGVADDMDPTGDVEYLRRVHWGRFGHVYTTKYNEKDQEYFE